MAKEESRQDDGLDEYFADNARIREFIGRVRASLAEHGLQLEPGEAVVHALDHDGHQHARDVDGEADRERRLATALDALRPHFAALLADQQWLPRAYGDVCTSGGMGGGIGQWLLFRAADHSLTLFSLVVPPGVSTPVHDHLAWGLVGLYRGEQEETVYRRVDDAAVEGRAELRTEEVRLLHPGDFYNLIPPEGDIHSVKTVSQQLSVSIHLLGTDAGCIWRHVFEPQAERVRRFRSGYTNVSCEDER